jgi:polygalacturonase
MKTTRRALIASTAGWPARRPWPLAALRPATKLEGGRRDPGRIKPPTIPRRDFPITRFGAKPGGQVDCTKAIAAALAAAAKAGGGRVVVPAGVWLTGAVHLKSRTELHVAKGATLKFSRIPPPICRQRADPARRRRADELFAVHLRLGAARHRPDRRGTLDGQADADHWWNWIRASRRAWSRPQAPDRHGRGGRPGRPAGVRGRPRPSGRCSSSPIAAGTS